MGQHFCNEFSRAGFTGSIAIPRANAATVHCGIGWASKRLTVKSRTLPSYSVKDLIVNRVKDHANLCLILFHDGQNNCPSRDRIDEIGGAVDGINNPTVARFA